ncbi:MAG TPA: BON domain-containing protein [Hyphomonas sp.]|nr:BON domain-containing protein [Hyphomonas sp.]
MDDLKLKKLVEDVLDWAPMVDEDDIAVVVGGGVVTLTGVARSDAEKRAAEAAVRRVKGIRDVIDRITVR